MKTKRCLKCGKVEPTFTSKKIFVCSDCRTKEAMKIRVA
jgi:hypothetical protein